MNEPDTTPTTPVAARRPGIRMRTVVAGLIALVVSASVLLGSLTEVDVPAKALALVVLLGAGALLLGSGIAAAVREQRAQYQDPVSRR